MSFTKRDYEAIARIIAERHQVQKDTVAQWPDLHNTCRNRRMELDMVRDAIAEHFTRDNPRFDPERFAKACEPGSGK